MVRRTNIFHTIIASGFGTGFSPFAPGTAGAILATIVWVVLSLVVPSYLVLITAILIVVFGILGIWSTNVLEPEWGEDPSRVVVDEMVGVWIALLAVSDGNIYYALAALVLFRLFDIFKPLGIRSMEKLKGGIGVMMDDVLAGIYSFIVLFGLRWLIG